MENRNILEMYEDFKEVFSEEISEEIREEYAVGELLTEFFGHYSDAKEFEKMVEFSGILREKNYKAFIEVAPYFNEFLIHYHCYHRNPAALREPIEDFAEAPFGDEELLVDSLHKLLYYGYTDLVDELIELSFKNKDDEEKEALEDFIDFAYAAYNIELERVYHNYQETTIFDWTSFGRRMEKYDYDIEEEEDARIANEESLQQELPEVQSVFAASFPKKLDIRLLKVRVAFQKYMLAYDVSFAASSEIWVLMRGFWPEKGRKLTKYFELDEASFKTYLQRLDSFFATDHPDSIACLWGAAYVYDFLWKAQLIEEEAFHKAHATIKKFKKAVMAENLYMMWKFDFFHRWKKPDSLEQEEWEAEKALFEQSYQTKYKDVKSKLHFFNERQLDFSRWQEAPSEPKLVEQKFIEPRTQPKIGRNDRVSVRYEDGSTKENIKYKFVERDIASGKCELF